MHLYCCFLPFRPFLTTFADSGKKHFLYISAVIWAKMLKSMLLQRFYPTFCRLSPEKAFLYISVIICAEMLKSMLCRDYPTFCWLSPEKAFCVHFGSNLCKYIEINILQRLLPCILSAGPNVVSIRLPAGVAPITRGCIEPLAVLCCNEGLTIKSQERQGCRNRPWSAVGTGFWEYSCSWHQPRNVTDVQQLP